MPSIRKKGYKTTLLIDLKGNKGCATRDTIFARYVSLEQQKGNLKRDRRGTRDTRGTRDRRDTEKAFKT